jgi:hypothetical protein
LPKSLTRYWRTLFGNEMRNVYQSFWIIILITIGAHVCSAQPQPPVRIQKAPAPVGTNNISVEELNRIAAEQNKMLERQMPWMAMSKTNADFARAVGYIVAEMAGHKPEKLPPGLTQNDISNAYFQMFIAPRSNHLVGTLQLKPTIIHAKISVSTPDGSPAWVDFFNQKVGRDGQMEISQNKPAYSAWQMAAEWSYRLAIADGGFIETSEEFPFQAPESGYQPVVEFNFHKDKPSWTEHLDKTFYVAFGNPRRYGRIHVVTSMTNGTILDYAISPDGTRNLEPK